MNTKRKIVAVAVACSLLLLQKQTIYAQKLQEPDTATEETTQTPEDGLQQTEDTSSQPSDTVRDPEENEPVPSGVKGLRTTKKSKKSVLLEWKAAKNATAYEIYRREKHKKYKLLDTTGKTRYVDHAIHTGRMYRYKIVACNGEKRAEHHAEIKFSNTKAVNIVSQKYTYSQMKKDMGELKEKYNDYCEMKQIGKSVKGRAIYDFAIGNPDAGKSLLVVSTLHGREYICTAVIMKEIEYYLENYNQSIDGMKPAKILKDMQIHYIVMANPDGVTISQKSHASWKANGRGVDLNRNFPAKKFKIGGKRGAQGYSGKKALSEPETCAVAKFTKKLKKEQKLKGVINYHAMGQIIYGSCYRRNLSKDTGRMYRIAKKQTGYRRASDSNGKAPGGQYREYVMYMLGIPSITIEVGRYTAPCSYREYTSEFQKNKKIVLMIAKEY